VALLFTGFRFTVRRVNRKLHASIYGLRRRLRSSLPTEIHGVTIDLACDGIPYGVAKSIKTGSYEGTERRFVQRYVKGHRPVIELGTGIGYVSCLINERLEGDVKQVSVEANADLIPIAERTKQLNGAGFTIVNEAYAPDRDDVEFVIDEIFPWSSRHVTPAPEILTSIQATSLRELCTSHGLETFTLVADVEGAEFDMIEHELDLLQAQCDLIIMELHDIDGESPIDLTTRLENAGFSEIDRDEDVLVFRNQSLSG